MPGRAGVPLLALGAVSAGVILERHDVARCSDEIVEDVDLLFDLVQLRFALNSERAAVLATVEGRALGIDESTVSLLLGTDVGERQAQARAQVDRMRSKLGAMPGATEAFRALLSLRDHSEATTPTAIKEAYNQGENFARDLALDTMKRVFQPLKNSPGADRSNVRWPNSTMPSPRRRRRSTRRASCSIR